MTTSTEPIPFDHFAASREASRRGGLYGAALRRYGPEAPETATANRDHRAARALLAVAELMRGTEPLTDDQIAAVVAVLQGQR